MFEYIFIENCRKMQISDHKSTIFFAKTPKISILFNSLNSFFVILLCFVSILQYLCKVKIAIFR